LNNLGHNAIYSSVDSEQIELSKYRHKYTHVMHQIMAQAH